MLTPEQIRLCMEVLPFLDGDDGVRRFSDKIVLARKDAVCCLCRRDARKGTHHRVETVIVDGGMQSCRYCEDCCAAMALSWKDDGAAMIRRLGLAEEANHA